MFELFLFAIVFTIGISGLCSILEAMILSTSTVDIETLKRSHPKRGVLLEKYRTEIEETSSAILSLNTIANTLGATFVGGLAVTIWADSPNALLHTSLLMATAILFFSEIIPKNLGVAYRPALQPWLVFPLMWICLVMKPISTVVGFLIKKLLNQKDATGTSDQEIVLLAEKSAQDGNLSVSERNMITNALSLEDLTVGEIMTPRTVVYALDADQTVSEAFAAGERIPFARIPIFRESIDEIIGVIRRRDLLSAIAKDEDHRKLAELSLEPVFIPDNVGADDALKTFLKTHQQLAIAVDEYGSMSGVVTMEDIIEQIIGEEIFEDDDPAIDMREYARRTQRSQEGHAVESDEEGSPQPRGAPLPHKNP